jgi:transcriptional regulator GlxA family with amidase domain
MTTIAFIIPPTVELLDLAGPVQVFTEARFYGLELNIEFFIYQDQPVSTCGLTFGAIPQFEAAKLKAGDYVFVPGMDQGYVRTESFKKQHNFFAWLKKCSERGVVVCSVCNGAFALGAAGLLDDENCTTHWRRTNELQVQFPRARVHEDTLYVRGKRTSTSGGIGAGIDLALSILEEMTSTHFTSKVARGLVVYRRTDDKSHESVHFTFRNHVNSKVHDVQAYLDINLTSTTSPRELAAIAGISEERLRREFEAATGTTLAAYLAKLRSGALDGTAQTP